MTRDEGLPGPTSVMERDFAPSPKTSGTTALDGSRFDLDDTTLANKSTFIRVQRTFHHQHLRTTASVPRHEPATIMAH